MLRYRVLWWLRSGLDAIGGLACHGCWVERIAELL
jgi:hypothetical protein